MTRGAALVPSIVLFSATLCGCSASPVRRDVSAAPPTTEVRASRELDAPAAPLARVVVPRAVRPTKNLCVLPRRSESATGGRRRPAKADPVPRRAWYEVVPGHPASPDADDR
jgi:hypothetical protein